MNTNKENKNTADLKARLLADDGIEQVSGGGGNRPKQYLYVRCTNSGCENSSWRKVVVSGDNCIKCGATLEKRWETVWE